MNMSRNPSWERKDLLGLKELSAEEISLVLSTAESFKEVIGRLARAMEALENTVSARLEHEQDYSEAEAEVLRSLERFKTHGH